MSGSTEFIQAAGEPLRRARARIEDAISDLPEHEAVLRLRMDFEDVLRTDHDVDDGGCAVLFKSLDLQPDVSAQLDHLLYITSSYVVARELGLVTPITLEPTH